LHVPIFQQEKGDHLQILLIGQAGRCILRHCSADIIEEPLARIVLFKTYTYSWPEIASVCAVVSVAMRVAVAGGDSA